MTNPTAMSRRSDRRKNPLLGLSGIPAVPAREPCIRCNKPETNRVIVVFGDAGWHMSVLTWLGFDKQAAASIASQRWAEEVLALQERAHELAPSIPLPTTPEEVTQLKGCLSYRVCRGCANKAGLQTISAETLNRIIDEQGMIPHVITRRDPRQGPLSE